MFHLSGLFYVPRKGTERPLSRSHVLFTLVTAILSHVLTSSCSSSPTPLHFAVVWAVHLCAFGPASLTLIVLCPTNTVQHLLRDGSIGHWLHTSSRNQLPRRIQPKRCALFARPRLSSFWTVVHARCAASILFAAGILACPCAPH